MSPDLHSVGKVLVDGENTSWSIDATNSQLTSARELSEPLVMITRALQSSDAVKLDFPSYRLTKLVTSRLDMDETDIADLATLLKLDLRGPIKASSWPFAYHLRHVMAVYSLGALFSDDGTGAHHHAIRPWGYDFYQGKVIALDMERWRAAYRAMPPERQMLAASIVWLYRGGADSRWLRRVPCTWHAADALECLQRTGVLENWARLLALYPGW